MQLLEKLVGVKTKDQFELPTKLVTGSNVIRLPEKVPANISQIPFNNPPLFFGNIETPEITADFLPAWIRDYVHALTENAQIPVGIAVMRVLTILAACIQKTFVVTPDGGDDCVEPLTLWTLSSLPTANNTLTVFDALVKPILAWEKEQASISARAVEFRDINMDVTAKEIQTLIRMASKADIQSLVEGVPDKKYIDLVEKILLIKQRLLALESQRKVLVTNIPSKKLLCKLLQNYHGTSIFSSDINLFKSIDPAILLQSYSGGSLEVEIGKQYIQLNNIALSLGLILNPEDLGELTNSKRHSFNRDLLAKFLYYLPPSNIGKRNFKNRKTISQDTKDAYSYGIKALLNTPLVPVMDQDTGRCRPAPRRLTLSKEALELWEQFLEVVESELGEGGKLTSLQDWVSVLPNQVLRIAGLIHIAHLVSPVADTKPSLPIQNVGSRLVIDRKTIEVSIKLAYKLIPHAQAAYDLLDNNKAIADVKYSLHWVLANFEIDREGSFYIKQHGLYTSSRFKKSKVARVKKALDILTARNILGTACTLPTRKPTNIRYLNPKVFELKEKFNVVGQQSNLLSCFTAS